MISHPWLFLLELYLFVGCIVGAVRLWQAHRRGHCDSYYMLLTGTLAIALSALVIAVPCAGGFFYMLKRGLLASDVRRFFGMLEYLTSTLLPWYLAIQGVLVLATFAGLVATLRRTQGYGVGRATGYLLRRWLAGHWRWCAGRRWWLKVGMAVSGSIMLVLLIFVGVPLAIDERYLDDLPLAWQRLTALYHPDNKTSDRCLLFLSFMEGRDPVLAVAALERLPRLSRQGNARFLGSYFNHDTGPALAGHLADNPDLVESLVAMDDVDTDRCLISILEHAEAGSPWAVDLLLRLEQRADLGVWYAALKILIVHHGYRGYRAPVERVLALPQGRGLVCILFTRLVRTDTEHVIRDDEIFRLLREVKSTQEGVDTFHASLMKAWRAAREQRGLPEPE